MLIGWNESHSRGRTVTFLLTEEDDHHPFKDFTVHKRAGQRFMAVFVQVGDDERPVEKTAAQMAYLLCKDESFRHFLNDRSFASIQTEEDARAHILEGCGIKSRGELDTNSSARAAWEVRFHQPWLKYLQSQLSVL
jgi:hypothetical protein